MRPSGVQNDIKRRGKAIISSAPSSPTRRNAPFTDNLESSSTWGSNNIHNLNKTGSSSSRGCLPHPGYVVRMTTQTFFGNNNSVSNSHNYNHSTLGRRSNSSGNFELEPMKRNNSNNDESMRVPPITKFGDKND